MEINTGPAERARHEIADRLSGLLADTSTLWLCDAVDEVAERIRAAHVVPVPASFG